MGKVISFFSIFFLLVSCGTVKFNYVEEHMTTPFSILVYAKGPSFFVLPKVKKAYDRIEELDNTFSSYKEDSPIYYLNETKKIEVPIDSDIYYEFEKAICYSKASQGAFDVTIFPLVELWGTDIQHEDNIPSQAEIDEALKRVGYENIILGDNLISLENNAVVDLGGLVKGYAVDEAIRVLKENGIRSGYVSAGGNIGVFGKKPNNKPWYIGIQNPLGEGLYHGYYIDLENEGNVSTSGSYYRYFKKDGQTVSHIMNPKTGYYTKNHVLSVTVVASKGEDSDPLSTMLFVMGEKGLEFANNHDIAAFFIFSEADGQTKNFYSDKWKQNWATIEDRKKDNGKQ